MAKTDITTTASGLYKGSQVTVGSVVTGLLLGGRFCKMKDRGEVLQLRTKYGTYGTWLQVLGGAFKKY